MNSERPLIDEAKHDLRREFPALSAHQISVLVDCLWAEYDAAVIRDFVPARVRKQAREELRDLLYVGHIEAASGTTGATQMLRAERP